MKLSYREGKLRENAIKRVWKRERESIVRGRECWWLASVPDPSLHLFPPCVWVRKNWELISVRLLMGIQLKATHYFLLAPPPPKLLLRGKSLHGAARPSPPAPNQRGEGGVMKPSALTDRYRRGGGGREGANHDRRCRGSWSGTMLQHDDTGLW